MKMLTGDKDGLGARLKNLPTFLDLWRKTMRLTSKGRYAVRAMLDLTFHSNGNPVRLQEISTRQSISLHYLEQLFRKLRTGKVVKSVRGPGGGYVLSRSMDEISIKDVLDCVGENINPARDILGIPSSGIEIMKDENGNDINAVVDTKEFNLTKTYFENLGTIMQDYLATTTLGDLARKTSGKDAFNADNANNASAIRGNFGGEINQ
jgi:Rrf2 family iron-sulfur cluster assembly transcriptional regulator